MLDTFARVADADLRGVIVWVPMVPGDSSLEAEGLVSRDKRFALQGWDARRAIGEAFAKTLRLKCPAWDVYLVYNRGARWVTGDLPPMPDVWMHQLDDYSGADPKLHLQPAKFEGSIRAALKK